MLDIILAGLAHLGTLDYWGAVIAGVLISAVVGLIPGVGTPMMMAITIPFVILAIEDPLVGIVLLATIGGVSNTLDSIPAILMGYPGPSTQVTYMEGSQLARRGLAARTLGTIYSVSAIGGVVGAIALILIIPIVRPFILNFSFSEIAAMALFGVAMVAVLSRGAMLKGIAGGLIGILLSTVGAHHGTATERFTFGTEQLIDGLPLIAVTLGIFALPEVLDLSATRQPMVPKGTAVISNREVFAGAMEGLRRWRVAVRHSLIGVFFGLIPGMGGAIIDWLSYAVGIALSKDKSQFGKGSLDGVIFAEAANNSKEGGQAIPTLAFGVPAGLSWVFVMAAMLAYGVSPGPQMLDRHADITIMLAVSFGIGNLLITLMGIALTGQLAKVTLIPYVVIGSVIIPISFLSAFQESGGWFGILVLLAFTPVGLAMKAFGWPRPPLVLGFILGHVIEINLQSALSAYGLVALLTRPLTLVLLVIALITVVFLWRINHKPVLSELAAGLPDGGAALDAALHVHPAPQEPVRNLGAAMLAPWRIEHWFGLFLLVVVGWTILSSYGFSDRARFLPLLVGIPIACLLLFHLLFLRRTASGEIMDIGLQSIETPGAGRTALILAAAIAVFVLLSATVGLAYASIAFATILPLIMCEGRTRWLSSVISGFLVAIVALVFLDYYMAVFWPDPVLWNWLVAEFGG